MSFPNPSHSSSQKIWDLHFLQEYGDRRRYLRSLLPILLLGSMNQYMEKVGTNGFKILKSNREKDVREVWKHPIALRNHRWNSSLHKYSSLPFHWTPFSKNHSTQNAVKKPPDLSPPHINPASGSILHYGNTQDRLYIWEYRTKLLFSIKKLPITILFFFFSSDFKPGGVAKI